MGKPGRSSDQFVERARISRLEEPDDPATVHQGEAIAVRERFGPVGTVGGRRFRQCQLEAIVNEVVRRRLGPGEKPPTIGRGSKPVRVRLQYGRRVVFRIDRDADEQNIRPREPLLQASS